jgi:hypothetical protein
MPAQWPADLAAGGKLSLLQGDSAGQLEKVLTATGTLDLTNPLLAAGSVADFVKGDPIDLINQASTGFSFSDDTLSVLTGV